MENQNQNIASNNTTKFQLNESIIEVKNEYLSDCKTIQNLLDDIGDDDDLPIPLLEIEKDTFLNVVNFLEEYNKNKDTFVIERDVDMPDWCLNYCKIDKDNEDNNRNLIVNLMLAGNYLDCQPLINLTCKYIADQIKDKPINVIRDIMMSSKIIDNDNDNDVISMFDEETAPAKVISNIIDNMNNTETNITTTVN